jgi:hypothetical protein
MTNVIRKYYGKQWIKGQNVSTSRVGDKIRQIIYEKYNKQLFKWVRKLQFVVF